MRRENGMTDPPPKRNSLCLSVFDQLAKSSKWINLKTKNRPQQRAVRKHRKHPWCEKESMPHLDSIDGAKKTTICSVLRVIWNWSEWDRLWGHQGTATIYSRRVIWVFWWGEAVASGEGCGFPKTGERAAVMVKIVVWGEFCFPGKLYQENATYHLPISCMFAVPKTISSRWVLLLENLQKITNSPALSFTNLLCYCCGFALHLHLQ
jgi:hypothetical protein